MAAPILTSSLPPKRVALVETTHWHAPLYFPALEAGGIRVVGVVDETGLSGATVGRRFGCPVYTDLPALLAAQIVDFAFVFGRHTDMPHLARVLIERRIPFAIEKPCGIRAADVEMLADLADDAGVFVSIPFIFRLSDTYEIIKKETGGTDLDHASFRFVAGPPRRYLDSGNGWMLDPAISGGGPLINLGIHFIDLFRLLAGEPVIAASADSTKHIHALPIEDFISLRLRTASGKICTLECGYTFPSDREIQREWTFSARFGDTYLLSGADSIAVHSVASDGRGEMRLVPARHETDDYYPLFVTRSLEAAFAGSSPLASLRDAASALRIVEAAYRSAGSGGATVGLAE